MKIISVLLVVGLLAFVGYQIFGIVKDVRKRKQLKENTENSDSKSD